MSSSWDEFQDAFQRKDLTFFQNLSADELNDNSPILMYIVNEKWTDVYPIYTEKFVLWYWTIKNCFTVFTQNNDLSKDIAWKLMDICPDKYKKEVVERLKQYPCTYSADMEKFVKDYGKCLDVPETRGWIEYFKSYIF